MDLQDRKSHVVEVHMSSNTLRKTAESQSVTQQEIQETQSRSNKERERAREEVVTFIVG